MHGVARFKIPSSGILQNTLIRYAKKLLKLCRFFSWSTQISNRFHSIWYILVMKSLLVNMCEPHEWNPARGVCHRLLDRRFLVGPRGFTPGWAPVGWGRTRGLAPRGWAPVGRSQGIRVWTPKGWPLGVPQEGGPQGMGLRGWALRGRL